MANKGLNFDAAAFQEAWKDGLLEKEDVDDLKKLRDAGLIEFEPTQFRGDSKTRRQWTPEMWRAYDKRKELSKKTNSTPGFSALATNAATFGFSDEISAGLEAAGRSGLNLLRGRPANLAQNFDRSWAEQQAYLDLAKENTSGVGQVAAAIVGGLSGAAPAKAAATARTAVQTLPQMARNSALWGMLFGGAQGVGATEGGVNERALEGIKGATVGGLVGVAAPAVASAAGAAVRPGRDWYRLRKQRLAERARAAEQDFAEVGARPFTPAVADNTTVTAAARGLGRTFFGSKLRSSADQTIEDLERTIRGAVIPTSPDVAGQRAQQLLRRTLTERSIPAAEVRALPPERLEEISSVGAAPSQLRFPPDRPEPVIEQPPLAAPRRIDTKEVESRLVPPPLVKYKPALKELSDVPIPPEMQRQVRTAEAEMELARQQFAPYKAKIEEAEFWSRAARQRYEILERRAPRFVKLPSPEEAKKAAPFGKGFRAAMMAREAIKQRDAEYASFVAKQAADLRATGALVPKSYAEWGALRKKVMEDLRETERVLAPIKNTQARLAAATENLKAVNDTASLARRQAVEAVNRRAIADAEEQAAFETRRLVDAERTRVRQELEQREAQRVEYANSVAGRAEAVQLATQRANQQADATHRALLREHDISMKAAERRVRRPIAIGTSAESLPTQFDAAYAQLARSTKGLQVPLLGTKRQGVNATATSRLLGEISMEGRGLGQLPGYKGNPFSETGAVRDDVMGLVEQRLGPEISAALRSYSDRRASGQFNSGMEGLRAIRSAVGRAIGAQGAQAGSATTNTYDQALVRRLYASITEDVQAAVTRMPNAGRDVAQQISQVDDAYRHFLNDVRRPLARIFGDQVGPEQAMNRLIEAAGKGAQADIRLLRSYFQVVDQSGDRFSAVNGMVARMTEEGLPGFVQAFGKLSDEARTLMFQGDAAALGRTLEAINRAARRMQPYARGANNATGGNLSAIARPGNLLTGVVAYLNVPVAITGSVGAEVASRILASSAFRRWLTAVPQAAARGARPRKMHAARGYAILREQLGINQSVAQGLSELLDDVMNIGDERGDDDAAMAKSRGAVSR